MKRLLLPAAVALALAVTTPFWFVPAPEPEHDGPSAALADPPAAFTEPDAEPPDRTLPRTTGDAAEVFRRAFWREPAPDDRILHAERREWVSEENGGVRRWQWFLAVRPGPAFSTWLREGDAFRLAPANRADLERLRALPAWFPRPDQVAACEIQRTADQGLTIIFDPAKNVLYATDAGHGFAVAARRDAPPGAALPEAAAPAPDWQPRR